MSKDFWSKTTSEPKRQYTYQVHFGDFEPFLVKSAKKPSFSLGEATTSYLNHTFKYPGRITWDELSITFYDHADKDNAARDLMKKLIASGYNYPSGNSPQNNLSTVSKDQVTSALGEVRMEQLNHAGQVIETWVLKNAWFSKIDFGQLEYDSDEVITIEMTLNFDWAELI
jgi:hypothetical protein